MLKISAQALYLIVLVYVFASQISADTAVISFAQYDLNVRLLPDIHRIEVDGTIKLPATQTSRDSIELRLSRSLDDFRVEVIEPTASAGSAKVEKKEIAEGKTTWTIRPFRPFPANEAVVLRFSYVGGGENPTEFFYVGPEVSFSNVWYPSLDGIKGTGHLRFSLPAGYTVVANGSRRSLPEEEQQGRFHFESGLPVNFSFAAGKYTVIKRNGKVPVSAYLLRPRQNIETHIDESLKTLAVLEHQFGPYPYNEFALIEVPSDIAAKAGNIGAFAIGGGFVARSQFFEQKFNLGLCAHEIAHEWWGHIIERTGSRGDFMLDEGLAQFGSLLAVEAIEGAKAAERFRRTGYPGFNAELFSGLGYLKLSAAGLDYRLADLPDNQLSYWVSYSKAGFVWDVLSRTVGREKFRQILRNFTQQQAFQSVTWEQFLQAVEDGFGRNLKWFYKQWFEQTGAPDWQLTWKQKGNTVRGVIIQSAPYYQADLEIQVNGNSRQRQMQIVQVRGARTEFTMPVKFRVKSAVLDPHFLVLHWTPEYRAEAAAIAGYTRGSFRIREGKLSEAEKEFRNAFVKMQKPDLYSVRFLLENGLARIFISQKKWNEAKNHLETALTSPSRRADVLPFTYLRLATVAKELKDDALLRRAVDAAVAADAEVENITGAGEAARMLLLP